MKKIFLGLPIFLMSSSIFATEYNQLQVDKSNIEFSFKQMGVKVDGKFKKINGALYFDDKNISNTKVNLNIDIPSIYLGTKDTEAESLGKDWFNAKVFPIANFNLTSIKLLSENKYEGIGKLSIKSQTKDVVFPITLTKGLKEANFEGQIKLNRIDFKIGEGVWSDFDTIANEVMVKFNINLKAK